MQYKNKWIAILFLWTFYSLVNCEKLIYNNGCGTCIENGFNWCFDKTYNDIWRTNCDKETRLIENHCPREKISQTKKSIENQAMTININNDERPIQLRPQRIMLDLSYNKLASFTFEYRPIKKYPLDLYYILDLSTSRTDEVQKLNDNLSSNFLNLNKKNYRVGYGSISRSNLQDENVSYAFEHQMNFNAYFNSDDSINYYRKDHLNFTNMKKLLHNIARRDDIGWNQHSRKIIVLITDGQSNLSNDETLVKFAESNKDNCFMKFNRKNVDDFVDASDKICKVKIILATTEKIKPNYNKLDGSFPENIFIVSIKNNFSDLQNQINKAYKHFTTSFHFKDDSDECTDISYFSNCGKPNGEIVTKSGCNFIRHDKIYSFEVKVENICENIIEKKKTVTITESITGNDALSLNIVTDPEFYCDEYSYYLSDTRLDETVENNSQTVSEELSISEDLYMDDDDSDCKNEDDCLSCLSKRRCSWCYDTNTCSIQNILVNTGCTNIIINNSTQILMIADDKANKDNDPVQLELKDAYMTGSLQAPQSIRFGYWTAKFYPTDFYFLLDSTNSIKKLFPPLSTHRNQSNFRYGFGTFYRKSLLNNTSDIDFDQNECNYHPYTFSHLLNFSTDIKKLRKKINKRFRIASQNTSRVNLELLNQIVICRDVIEWRKTSRKFIVVVTNGYWNQYNILADISERKICFLENGKFCNNMNIHLEQILEKIFTEKFKIIFAVTNKVKPEYDILQRRFPRSIFVAELWKNNSNVQDVIESGYNYFSSSFGFEDNGTCTKLSYKSDCNKSMNSDIEESFCKNIEYGKKYSYTVTIERNCSNYDNKKITITESNFGIDKFHFKLNTNDASQCSQWTGEITKDD